MKKLITILSALSLTSSASIAVVACANNTGEDKTPQPENNEKADLTKLDLQLNIENAKGPNYSDLANDFYLLNKDKLPEGSQVSDLYVSDVDTSNEIGKAKVSGSQTSTLISDESTLNVTFKVDSSNQIKLNKVSGLITDMGEFSRAVEGEMQSELATKFLELNKTLISKETTVSNFYVPSSKINNQNGKAFITGSNSQYLVSSFDFYGVELTYSFAVTNLSDMNLTTNLNVESNEEVDVLDALLKANPQLVTTKLGIENRNGLIYLISKDTTVYRGEIQLTTTPLLKLAELGFVAELGTINEANYAQIRNAFFNKTDNQQIINDKKLLFAPNTYDESDFFIDSITSTSAIIKANTKSTKLSQKSSIIVTFVVGDTRTNISKLENLNTDLGELTSASQATIYQAFYKQNKASMDALGATVNDLYTVAKEITLTGALLQGATASNVLMGSVKVSFTIPQAKEKIDLNSIEGIDFDLGPQDWEVYENNSNLRPKDDGKLPAEKFIEKNKDLLPADLLPEHLYLSANVKVNSYVYKDKISTSFKATPLQGKNPQLLPIQFTITYTMTRAYPKAESIKSAIKTVTNLDDLTAVNSELDKYENKEINAIEGVGSLKATLKEGSTTDVVVTITPIAPYSFDASTFEIAGAIKAQ